MANSILLLHELRIVKMAKYRIWPQLNSINFIHKMKMATHSNMRIMVKEPIKYFKEFNKINFKLQVCLEVGKSFQTNIICNIFNKL